LAILNYVLCVSEVGGGEGVGRMRMEI